MTDQFIITNRLVSQKKKHLSFGYLIKQQAIFPVTDTVYYNSLQV